MRKFYVCTVINEDDDSWDQQVLTEPARVVSWMTAHPEGHVAQWELGDTDTEGEMIGP